MMATMTHDPLPGTLISLRQQALDRYRGQALWNVPTTPDVAGMREISRALRAEGDMAAISLIEDIERELRTLGVTP